MNTKFDALQSMCETNKRNFDDNEARLVRLLKQTSHYDDLVKKINENDTQRRIFESRLTNELTSIKNTGDVNRTQISYMQVEMQENVKLIFNNPRKPS